MTCANCHGLDGRGNPEGGVTPSDVTWATLSKPYGLTHQDGRKHPAYTDRSLATAIVKGIDPAGNNLQQTMPRYWVSRQDLTDLVAYMKRLGADADPGLTDTSLKLGTILPAEGSLAEVGLAMKAALTAYFEEINAQGGVYNRRIELVSGAAPKLIDDDQAFAIVSGVTTGVDKRVATLAQEKEAPVIGPSTLHPYSGSPPNRYVFYVFSGIEEQALALVNYARRKLEGNEPRITLVHADSGELTESARVISERMKKAGSSPSHLISYSAASFDAGRVPTDVDAILFIGPGSDARSLMREVAAMRSSVPLLLIPGALAGRDVFDQPAAFKDKVLLSFPTIPSDLEQTVLNEYRELARKHNLPRRHIAAQFSALCAAKVMIEGLKLAGRGVSREKLVIALEGLYELQTGLAPPITYGPNRRIGALGAYVVGVDPEKKEFKRVSGWIKPD
jgi:ABC-type branched-subunit amino acid transport system substrate-binding protein